MDRDIYSKIVSKLKLGEEFFEKVTETITDIFTPNETNVDTNSLVVSEKNGVVTVNGYVKLNSATATGLVIGTIAEGHRPASDVRVPCGYAEYAYDAPTGIGYLTIDPDGVIKTSSPANNTSLCVYFSCSFIVGN